MSSIRTQSLWSMIPILVTSLISIVSVPIYFRVLGDEMYAIWFYVGTLTGAFGFMDLGIGVAVGRFMGVAMGAGDDQAVKEYWSTGSIIAFPLIALLAIAFIIFGIILAPEWFKVPEKDVDTLRWAVVAGGAGLFFSYYGQMWFVLSATHLDFRFVSLVRTVLSLFSTIGTVLVAVITKNAAWLVAFGVAASVIQFSILIHRARNQYKMPIRFPDFHWSRMREMLPFTVKTFATLISGSFLGTIDRILLGRLAPATEFAAYNVALNVGSRVQNLSQAAMGPIFCNSTRGVGGDAERQPASIYKQSFAFLFPWYAAFLVWLLVWQGPLLQLWLGSNADAVGQAFSWIVAGCCLAAWGNLSGAQLGPIDRAGLALGFSIVVSLLSAILVTLGWVIGGLNGAAAGFFAARLLLLAQDALVRRFICTKSLASDIRPHCWIAIAGAGCLAVRLVIGWLPQQEILNLVGAVLCGVITVVVLCRRSFHLNDPTNKKCD